MGDTLLQAVQRARVWPEGSGARLTLARAASQLLDKRRREIAELEDLLARQWAWLGAHGSPGQGDSDDNSERYESGMQRYLLTLASYEDAIDGLDEARTELDRLAA